MVRFPRSRLLSNASTTASVKLKTICYKYNGLPASPEVGHREIEQYRFVYYNAYIATQQ